MLQRDTFCYGDGTPRNTCICPSGRAKGGREVHLTGKGIIDQLSPRRHLWLLIFDASVWICAVLFAWLARLDFQPDNMRLGQALLVAFLAATFFTFVAWFTRLHDGRAPLGSLEEIILLGSITLFVGVLIYFLNLVPAISLVPRSVPLIATLCAILLMAWGRAMVRAIRETSTPSPGASPGASAAPSPATSAP